MRGDTAREGTRPGRGRSRAEDTACCLGPWSAQCRQAASASMGAQAPWLLPLWPRCVFRATLPTPRSPLLSSPPGRSWSPQEFPAQWGPRRDGIFNKCRAEDAEEQRWACLPGRAGKDIAAEPQPLLCSPRGAQRSPSRLQPLLLPHRCVTDSMGTPSHNLQDGFLETATLGPRTHSRSPSNIVSFSTISL